MFKKMTPRTAIKVMAWTYLVIFSLAMLINLVMEAIARDFQGALENIFMLLAPISLGLFHVRGHAPLVLVYLAAVPVFMPISAAHKFWSEPEITIGMYVLFIPMLLSLIYVGLKSVKSKAT